jgi:hypothetical protein
MKEEYTEFAEKFARSVIALDFDAAHKRLAPWLQKELTDTDLRAVIENGLRETNEVWEINELIYPADFRIGGNSSALEDLKEDPGWRTPRQIPAEITEENFRQWMFIEFLPDEDDERIEFDGWFDFWFILVEQGGEFRIGYFEITDVD